MRIPATAVIAPEKLTKYLRVALKRDLPGQQLRAGDVAYLVDRVPHPAGGEVGCVLEVFNALGESIATVTIPESDIEPLSADHFRGLLRRCLRSPQAARG